jgi:hypothetical protein
MDQEKQVILMLSFWHVLMLIIMAPVILNKASNMNNKFLVITIFAFVIVLLLVGYGFNRWQRSQILQGDRDVLLIDKKTNSYSFLSSSSVDDIENRAKVIGFVDEFSSEELAKLTEGLQYSGSSIGPNTPISPSIEIQSPEESDLMAWNTLIGTLSTQQISLCDQMPVADLAQFCVVNHIIFQAKQANQSAETICPGMYIEEYRKTCESRLQEESERTFVDVDNNNLLDSFELYTGKADQFRS